MRTVFLLAIVSALLLVSVGCMTVTPLPFGTLYTSMKTTAQVVDPAVATTKTGEAKATAIIGICTGDLTVDTAMKSVGITKVHHVDVQTMSILGVYSEITTIVHGE